MFINRGRQSKRKYIIGICAIIFVYLFLFSRYQTFEYQEVIKNTKPETVWEYVADFSKMKLLNPTIVDFKILSDHGNNEDWQYTVEYIENMSHWPYWKNQAVGNYHVKKVVRDRKYLYLVESTHKTCFFSFYCGKLNFFHSAYLSAFFKFYSSFTVKAKGEFQISDLNNEDTLVVESIKYQCPPFLGTFCRREVEYQRKKIMFNLSYHFSSQQKM